MTLFCSGLGLFWTLFLSEQRRADQCECFGAHLRRGYFQRFFSNLCTCLCCAPVLCCILLGVWVEWRRSSFDLCLFTLFRPLRWLVVFLVVCPWVFFCIKSSTLIWSGLVVAFFGLGSCQGNNMLDTLIAPNLRTVSGILSGSVSVDISVSRAGGSALCVI